MKLDLCALDRLIANERILFLEQSVDGNAPQVPFCFRVSRHVIKAVMKIRGKFEQRTIPRRESVPDAPCLVSFGMYRAALALLAPLPPASSHVGRSAEVLDLGINNGVFFSSLQLPAIRLAFTEASCCMLSEAFSSLSQAVRRPALMQMPDIEVTSLMDELMFPRKSQ
eukprot:s1232_g10.t1